MTVERYNQIAGSGNLPQMHPSGVESLRKMIQSQFEVPFNNGSENKLNIKGRVEHINDIEARVKNGNRNAKLWAMLKAALIIGAMVAGAVLLGTTTGIPQILGGCLLGQGIGFYLFHSLDSPGAIKSRELIGDKGPLRYKFLAGPLYEVYTTFKFNSHYNQKRVDEMKVELAQDVDTAKAKIPNLGKNALDELKSFLEQRDLSTSGLERAEKTIKEIEKLHQL